MGACGRWDSLKLSTSTPKTPPEFSADLSWGTPGILRDTLCGILGAGAGEEHGENCTLRSLAHTGGGHKSGNASNMNWQV